LNFVAERRDGLDHPGAGAIRARLAEDALQGLLGALARDADEAEFVEGQRLGRSFVLLQRLLQRHQDFFAVAALFHVDKVTRALSCTARNTADFEEFGIQHELDKFARQVWLKPGGTSCHSSHTEALVGALTSSQHRKLSAKVHTLEDTTSRQPPSVLKEIVRQDSVRDLGGFIVVDFIDMERAPQPRKSLDGAANKPLEQEQTLRPRRCPSTNSASSASRASAPSKPWTRVLCQPCPYCTGSGMVKSIRRSATKSSRSAQDGRRYRR